MPWLLTHCCMLAATRARTSDGVIRDRFPYRVIYEVLEDENTVVVAAVLHAARDEKHWQERLLNPGE